MVYHLLNTYYHHLKEQNPIYVSLFCKYDVIKNNMITMISFIVKSGKSFSITNVMVSQSFCNICGVSIFQVHQRQLLSSCMKFFNRVHTAYVFDSSCFRLIKFTLITLN